MRPTDNINKLIGKLKLQASAELDKKVHDDISKALDGPAHSKPGIWRIIMKTRTTKLAAAAVIIAGFFLAMTFFDKATTPAYALEQTIAANHTIRTIHLRIFSGDDSDEKYSDLWLKYDDAGMLSNLRWNMHDDDGVSFSVWNEGVVKTWMPEKNVVIVIRVNNVEEYWQHFAEKYDPRLILQRLYDDSRKSRVELEIDEPAADGDFVYIKAIDTDDDMCLELVVDRRTKLVKEFSEFSVGRQEDELDMRIEFIAYNEPVDPSVFQLTGIPDDAQVYDQVDRLVGLEQGDLTEDEIAVEVVRAGLEAAIVHDYDEVSRLMEGDPGDTIEEFIDEEFGARLVRVVSIGRPQPHDIWGFILCVPCEVEIENEAGTKWIVNIKAMAKPVEYQPGDRWIVHDDLEVVGDAGIIKGTIVPGEKVGEYRLGMSKDEVLEKLGKPRDIFLGREEYTLDNLPDTYYMTYHGLTILIVDDLVAGISVNKPSYKFDNGVVVGDSEQKVLEAFGDDFQLKETEWKDFLTYKDEGLQFEINKEKRTVMEINIFPTDHD